MLCCSPLLGTGGKATFNTLVAHDSFLHRHGRKVYDAILLHVTRVFMLVDEAVITDPGLFAIGSANLFDIGTASITRDMSAPTDPAAAKGPYNFVDEATTHFNLFSYHKYTWQQQLSCTYFADQQTQPCRPPGGFAKATVDTAEFLYVNKLLPYYKNASFTQATYIDSTYSREAAALMRATPRSMTLASLRTRGPGLETALPPAPTATKCGAQMILAAKAATFGDGHAPGGTYLDDVECAWVIPRPSSTAAATAGRVVTLSLSLFSCEVEKDYLDIYAGSDATGTLLGHFTGRMSNHAAANGGVVTVPSVATASSAGMFVVWKTDNIMSRAWKNPSEDGFTATYDAEAVGCTSDAQCGGGGGGGGSGTCDAATGLCSCRPGYGGSDCNYDSCFGTVHLQGGGTLLSHGSGRTTSRNNARCVWELETGDPDRIASLRFDKFDLENSFDHLRVYSYGESGKRELLRAFSGNAYAAGLVVRSPGARLAVEFSSDALTASNGFQLTFESKSSDKNCETDADCSNSGACRQQSNVCECRHGFTGNQCECGPGLCVTENKAYIPLVTAVRPSVMSPKGGKLSIIGEDFRPGFITVNVADKVCVEPVFKSDTLIECSMPPGVGGPHDVVVTCGGSPSAAQRIFSYNLPHIYDISKTWVADGTRLRVKGMYFVQKSMRCRIDGFSESIAVYIDDSQFECPIQFEPASTDRAGRLEKLEISNDDGQRWVSGVTLDSPVVWGWGSAIPVAPRTIKYPKEVVVGGLIPTDRYVTHDNVYSSLTVQCGGGAVRLSPRTNSGH